MRSDRKADACAAVRRAMATLRGAGTPPDADAQPERELPRPVRRLATPWTVARWRADEVAPLLPPGVIVDPACGSGLALAAHAVASGRVGLGIESDEAAARTAIESMPRWLARGARPLDAVIVRGDGRVPELALLALRTALGSPEDAPVALLHLDPARPTDAGSHDLTALDPPLGPVLGAWSERLARTETGPAVLLDLPPRLTAQQRADVASTVEEALGPCAVGWTWSSQGRGRIDRLEVRTGPLATAASRVVRWWPDGRTAVLEGPATATTTAPAPHVARGDRVVLLDPVVVAAGLYTTWLDAAGWSGAEGPTDHARRPLVVSPTGQGPAAAAQAFVMDGGEVVDVFEAASDLEGHMDAIVAAAREHELGRLTLRCALPPEQHPVHQAALDRQLDASLPRTGRLLDGPAGVRLLILADPPTAGP